MCPNNFGPIRTWSTCFDLREKLAQSHDPPVSDHHIPESVDISLNSVKNSVLAEYILDEDVEVPYKC